MSEHPQENSAQISIQQASIEGRTQDTRKNILLVLPFLLLFFVQLAHHQMWRDELNAWGIAVASPTLTALFSNLHYEGHQSLWYLLLWFPSRWTASPLAIKIVEAFIGTAIYLVIGLWAPFSRIEKVLLLLSYFISFEYTVISRTYGLFLLVALLYTHVRTRSLASPITAAVLLGILANTDIVGVILSGAFVAEWACHYITQPLRPAQSDYRRYYTAGAIYLLSLAIAYQTTTLAKDISWRTTGRMFEFATDMHHLSFAIAAYTVAPLLPIGEKLNFYWTTPVYYHRHVYLALVPFALAAIYMIFRRDRCLIALIGLTMGAGIAFSHLIYLGSTRHFGVVFVAILAALWIQRSRSHRPSIGIYLLLCLFALSGGTVAIAQWIYPFSNAGNAAHWIQSHGLKHVPIVGTPDTSVAGIAEELQVPAYFLDCSCIDTFLRFANRRDNFDESQIPERLKLAPTQLHATEMILIMVRPLTPAEVGSIANNSFDITPLASFSGAAAYQEDFYLYKVRSVAINPPK